MINRRYCRYMPLTGLLLVLALGGCRQAPEAVPDELRFGWHWQRFQQTFIDVQGRVIDRGSERSISTSEGQAYALFFALVANQPEQFAQLLNWTEANLAQGALADNLPAWLWGHADDGDWRVLDGNAASDADVWLAYTLLQAGRLWRQPRYSALGKRLAKQIIEHETVQIGEQLILLPAPQGFQVDENTWRLNPSYFSLPLFVGLAHDSGDKEAWLGVYQSSLLLLQEAIKISPYVGDWLQLQGDDAQTWLLTYDEDTQASYDAIRTYLWLALDWQRLQQAADAYALTPFAAMADITAELSVPPRSLQLTRRDIDATSIAAGPIGFSAVLLPYLKALDEEAYQAQRLRITALQPAQYQQNYYDHVLLLFGLGGLDCFSFSRQGELKVRWHEQNCQV